MIEINIQKTLHGSNGEMVLTANKEIKERTFLTIAGQSGSGKTTLLRIIAGLETPESGKLIVNNRVWFDSEKKINLPPQKRKIGFVFQNYSLFPHMSVRENLLFVSNSEKLVDELLEIVELKELSNRYPETLSGGQQQRVALARAIVREPDILLLDEPLSALDSEMRGKLQEEIVKIHKHFKITTILVSHDLSEIFKLSNRVFMVESGEIVKDERPENIYFNQQTTHKFSFIGEVLKIEKIDIIYKATVAIGNNISKVVLTKDDTEEIKEGDKILIASKAFNPIVQKI